MLVRLALVATFKCSSACLGAVCIPTVSACGWFWCIKVDVNVAVECRVLDGVEERYFFLEVSEESTACGQACGAITMK